MKEWITLIVFIFYGSLASIQTSYLLLELPSAAFGVSTAIEFLKCLVVMRPPKDPLGYWLLGWILLWLPFAGVALFSLDRSLRFATLTYSWSAAGGTVLAVFFIGLFYAFDDPEMPARVNEPGQDPFIHYVLRIALSIVPVVLAATLLANCLIRAGEALTHYQRHQSR
jgi:hypothetical protein